ncbi:MAG: DNA polymerase III subunit alpha [Pseudomonadota bacterium]
MVPLNVRSHYSLMWGTASVKHLCRRARELGYTRLALTDTDNLCGMWPFISACRQEGIDPIIGAEVTDPHLPLRAVCLVKNSNGYTNLCRLLTQRHRDPGFVLEQALPGFAQGLSVLTRSPELLVSWHDQGVDVMAHFPREPLHQGHDLCRAAGKYGLPIIATPGSFFLDRTDAPVHRMLRAIAGNTCLSRLGSLDVAPDSAFLASPEEYRTRFAVVPQALANSIALAERLEFRGPEFGTVMPPFGARDGPSAEEQLARDTLDGAAGRYGLPLPTRVRERISHELGIIRLKRFCEYFLVVRDIVKKSPRICGRGSGAASIVAYCLGITNVCPIKFNLYFERFLNPGRQDPPDIDVDFAWDERDRILNGVLRDHAGHAAMVSSHVLFQPRMAVREVARVFGLPDREIGTISRKLPWFWSPDGSGQDLLSRIRQRPEFRNMDFPQPWPGIMGYAQAMIGIPRYLSVHPGGVVITPDPIDHYVPIQTAPKGVPLMQWEKDGAEEAGLVKIDLLGNRSLGVIRDAVRSIESRGTRFDGFDQDPEDDLETQSTVAQGNTMGCFYIESPAMRLLQKKSRVGDFEHVVIHSSIIRPAANEFIREYIKRLHTGEWEPIHPLLSDVLRETFGIMVYQEDVSRVAVHMAGFSHVEADALRKIMSKKDKEHVLRDFFGKFEAGASVRGVPRETIRRVWDMIVSFSGYSFCKPHSASYARVSFQAAFLKTHYPAEFMAAVISNQGGFYSTFAYVSEARRMGVTVAGPDVGESQIAWTGANRVLRVGLMAIKGLSGTTMDAIVRERGKSGFPGVFDFFNRVRPHGDEVRALVHSGALDRFDSSGNRSGLLWAFADWQRQRQSRSGEPCLFDQVTVPVPLPALPTEDPMDRLRREFRVLGFLRHIHPMVLYTGVLEGERTVKARDLPGRVGSRVRFAGWLLTGKVVKTRHGDPMEFLTFEDETGIVETTFFPRVYSLCCHMLDHGRPYILQGSVDSDWGAVTLTVEGVTALDLSGEPEKKVTHNP